MKLPFEFGLKFFFRLLVPGFLLSLGLWPVSFFLIDLGGWQIKHELVLAIVIVLAGFLIMVSDMQIYMLFEGRRYWPASVRLFFLRREQRRLNLLKARATVAKLNSIHLMKRQLYDMKDAPAPVSLLEDIVKVEGEYQEAQFDLRRFPQDNQFEHYVCHPSRLGNTIAAFEGYPSRSYGMDAVFYWPRLWLKLDKETREEIDSLQALADSSLYDSFALYLSGLLWLSYDLLFTANSLVVRFAPRWILRGFQVTLFEYLPNRLSSWLLVPSFLVAGYGLYRASLRLHAQFGETFKGVFDVFGKEIDVSAIYAEIAPILATGVSLGRKEQLSAVFRYLQYGLVKCYLCGIRMPAGDAKSHTCPPSRLPSGPRVIST